MMRDWPDERDKRDAGGLAAMNGCLSLHGFLG